MNAKHLKNLSTVVAAICLSATVYAEDVEIPRVVRPDSRAAAKAGLLQKYDGNRNGKLDPDEIETIGRERMLRFDDNRDGRVDQIELKRQRTGVRRMPEMDDLQRAMACEQALQEAKVQREKERTEAADRPGQGSQSEGGVK